MLDLFFPHKVSFFKLTSALSFKARVDPYLHAFSQIDKLIPQKVTPIFQVSGAVDCWFGMRTLFTYFTNRKSDRIFVQDLVVPEVQNRGISGPTKITYILQKFFKKKACRFVNYLLIEHVSVVW